MRLYLKAFIILSFTFSFNIHAQSDTTYYFKAQKETEPLRKIHYYTKAIELCGDSTGELKSSYLGRAMQKYELEDYYGTIADVQKVLQVKVISSKVYPINFSTHLISAQDELLYLLLGDCHIALGNKEKGCLAYSRGVEIGSQEALNMIKMYCQN